ncbi:hypothetical protein ACU8V7_00975 [Zobellia nedashkovskayae]
MPLLNNIINLVSPYLITSLILFISLYFYQFFDFERIENKKIGHIEFNDVEIILDYSHKIQYIDLLDFQISVVDYYGKKINLTHRNPVEKRALGIRNHLNLVTKSNIFKFNIKLENELHQYQLEKLLFDLVTEEKFIKVDIATQVKLIPTRFNKTDIYKNFIIKQIVKRRINCTEGLLLHGYTSDKEAADLRKKIL